ncbi:MAG TPA: glycoside hydrolase family 2 TIM barrel-domain containing protein [Spirochaetales bacterium]|nr:glycoside hydrolase family 2 TIM barrel-domain containing protein [Spirochaetales bacterium]
MNKLHGVGLDSIDAFYSGMAPWADPAIQEVGRLPISSLVYHFSSTTSALNDAMSGPEGRNGTWSEVPQDSSWAVSLNGAWEFRLFDTVEEALACNNTTPAPDSAAWDEIMVPGAWCLQGYDHPHYTNVIMPFDAVWPDLPTIQHVGIFRKAFLTPESWDSGDYVLRIGSAESLVMVWLDGEFVGLSKDSRLPAEFLLPTGAGESHVLTLMVVQYTDASFIEDQDEWWLGGLHRSVMLLYRPKISLQDVRINATVQKDCGSVDVVAQVRAYKKVRAYERIDEDAQNVLIRCELYDANGKFIDRSQKPLPQSYAYDGLTTKFTFDIDSPAIWSHEDPTLYFCALTIVDGESATEMDAVAQAFGFRSVKIDRGSLLINEKRVFIQGVNRHEFSQTGGRALTTQEMVRDIELLKEHHFNAVRCSHYPNDERWYELCDRYGLYLVDEANIETHAYYDQICRDPAWSTAFLARAQRMVLRDKNHPSIILWSLGNESGYGYNHDLIAGWIRSYDPSRPLHYEGAVRPEWGQKAYTVESLHRGKLATDIICPMYPPIDLISQWDALPHDERPLIMCEYSHAMGNSNGSLSDYWAAIRSSKSLQGGFIWEWVDHGILEGANGRVHSKLQPGPNAEYAKPWRYGGDFGDFPSDMDFVCDGLLFPDRSLKPVMAECSYLFQPLEIVLKNGWQRAEQPNPAGLRNTFGVVGDERAQIVFRSRMYFKSTGPMLASWRIESALPQIQSPVAEGKVTLDSLEPDQFESMTIDLAPIVQSLMTRKDFRSAINTDLAFANGSRASLLILSITLYALEKTTDGQPKELAKESFGLVVHEIPAYMDTKDDTTDCQAEMAPKGSGFSHEALQIAVSPEGFIDALKPKRDGLDASSLIAEPIIPVLFRAPTQNDGLKNFISLRGIPELAFYYQDKAMYPWLDAGLEWLHFESLEQKQVENRMILSHRIYTSNNTQCGAITQELRFIDSSEMALSVSFNLDPIVPEYPRIGLKTRLRSGLSMVQWCGYGPQENYPDRQQGALLGRYLEAPEGFVTPYIVPQENGSRGGVLWAMLQFQDGLRLLVQATKAFSFGVSPYSEHELWEARHFDELQPIDVALADGAWFYLDIAQRGVGTATCGPDTLPRYRLYPGKYDAQFFFKILF